MSRYGSYGSYGSYRDRGCCAFSIVILIIGMIVTCVVAYYIKREQRKKKDLTKYSNILISGASEGVGKQLAILFASSYKCNIIILDTDEKYAKTLLARIKINGGQGYFYQCDFKDRNMVLRTVAEIIANFTYIDIFINTGGVALEKSFEEYCHEEILAVMEANFFGPIILTKEILPIMKARGKGHIVNVPSNLDVFDSQDILAYCGTKTAFSKVLQGLQAEMKMNNQKIKITIAKPLFAISEKSASKQAQKEQSQNNLKTRIYAKKIFDGIIYEAEEI